MRPFVTVVEAIQKGAAYLEKYQVDSPRLQAELLLAHLRKLPRLRLYLQFDSPLAMEEENAYRELLVRRGKRVPLQHLVGGVSFCGIELASASPLGARSLQRANIQIDLVRTY